MGDTTYCDYPPEAKTITKVGTFSEPNLEKILSLKPDVVFTTGLEQTPTVVKLQNLGLKVIVSDPASISELFESILIIGAATGKDKAAQALIANMKQRIEVVRGKVQKIAADKRPRVFLEIWHDPIMTVGPGSIVDELLTTAGGVNIAYDAPRAYSRFSGETIIDRDPDAVIMGYMVRQNAKDMIHERMGWENIKAVRNNRVIADINPDLILRPGPRLVDGLEQIYQKLYDE